MAENQNTAVVEDATYTPHGDDNNFITDRHRTV